MKADPSLWKINCGHMRSDTTHCDATFCPCPTYTSMIFWEENLTHKQRSCTIDVPLLFLYSVNVRIVCPVDLCPPLHLLFLGMNSWRRPSLGQHSPSPFCLSVSLSTLMRDDSSSYPWLVAVPGQSTHTRTHTGGNGKKTIERTKENRIDLLLQIDGAEMLQI